MTPVNFEKFTISKREKIFETATNYESFQTKLPKFFPSIRIVSARPNTTLVEEHLNLAGKELIVMAKHVVEPPTIHETFFVGGDAKGTHITEKYEETPKGTKILLTVEFKPKGSIRFSRFFGGEKFEGEFSKIMDQLISISEA